MSFLAPLRRYVGVQLGVAPVYAILWYAYRTKKQQKSKLLNLGG
jgi:hypothetical protein